HGPAEVDVLPGIGGGRRRVIRACGVGALHALKTERPPSGPTAFVHRIERTAGQHDEKERASDLQPVHVLSLPSVGFAISPYCFTSCERRGRFIPSSCAARVMLPEASARAAAMHARSILRLNSPRPTEPRRSSAYALASAGAVAGVVPSLFCPEATREGSR